jgi:cytoskeletal protein RodZ
MTKYLALATGAAIAIAATLSYAQTTPPSTDRPSGQPGEATSAKPDPDKKGGSGKGATATPKAGTTQAPPSTDRPAGSEDTTSAKPNPDKKQKQ